MNRLHWVFCQLGIKRSCEKINNQQTERRHLITDIERRQEETARRLKYLGYDVDAHLGLTTDYDGDRGNGTISSSS